ncbi:endonuclease/exonuclease/phosphatase family protein [Myceligenerans salitolerans]|uniref:Endonuclease/exonuclease/phosphatase family protein n=1 Tax=Myceligenerans salitolerans TaxID=1230528 RepID=A0ABS3IBP9_9MICO|nr:endonuclease/exonuclease/phosphatase family protein [Myceligenerans salitolerans]
MRRPALRATGLVLAAALVGGGGAAVAATGPVPDRGADARADRPASSAMTRSAAKKSLRVATYNLSLNRATQGQLVADLSDGGNEQARTVAEVIQHVRPDVVLLNEFDHDDAGEAARLFRENYLEVPQGDAEPIEYRYAFVAPSNTGVPSGFDLNNDGTVGGGDDALGFGLFPGQYGMVVLSRYPIDADRARTFQHFRWQDMPGAALPTDPATGEAWYTDEELDALPLSSKSHWDVPVRVGHRTVHVLAAHPTPPTFDGAEDRNGRRNHDEIRFWADYVTGGRHARYIYDDDGRRGGLHRGASFVILGDYNADPADGDSYDGAIHQLLDNRRIQDPAPRSEGAVEAAELQGGANESHTGDPALDTADFADTAPGNLRADYTLPSRNLRIRDAGVFWPTQDDPLSRLTGTYPFPSSDHRLVWVDLKP